MHIFHSWSIWETREQEKVTKFFTGSTALAPASQITTTSAEFFQFKQCTKCGKRKTVKL